MSDAADRETVIDVLYELGLDHWQAEQAADDPQLAWDMDGLRSCATYLDISTARRPAAALWVELSRHHTIPRDRNRKPNLDVLPADDGPVLCPWCKGPWFECEGSHGWVVMELA